MDKTERYICVDDRAMIADDTGQYVHVDDYERLLIDARLMVHAYQSDTRPHDAWIQRIRDACKAFPGAAADVELKDA